MSSADSRRVETEERLRWWELRFVEGAGFAGGTSLAGGNENGDEMDWFLECERACLCVGGMPLPSLKDSNLRIKKFQERRAPENEHKPCCALPTSLKNP